MAYIVTRNRDSGFVAFVEKGRVRLPGGGTTVRNKAYVCGLGVMSQEEFEEFKAWAHAITHQESRKEAVLACPRVVKKTEETTAQIAETQQAKTTVKKAKKVKTVDPIAEEEKAKAKEEERIRFRAEYEARKGIKTEKTVKAIPDGIQFTGRKTISEKRKILDERITELNYRIANSKTDIIIWQKGRAAGSKITDAKELIAQHQSILKTLKRQRSELRR